MDMSQVNELLSKGFTAEFIMGLEASPVTAQNADKETISTPAPEPVPEPESQQEAHAPEPVPEPESRQEAPAPAQLSTAPAQSNPTTAPGTELDRLFSELRNLTNAIQAQNRLSADMGANIIDPQTAVQNALAGIGGLPVNTNN